MRCGSIAHLVDRLHRGINRRIKSNRVLRAGDIKIDYTGLLEEDIVDMNARSVADIIQRGGTILYTARCPEFMTANGQDKGADICRKRAAHFIHWYPF